MTEVSSHLAYQKKINDFNTVTSKENLRHNRPLIGLMELYTWVATSSSTSEKTTLLIKLSVILLPKKNINDFHTVTSREKHRYNQPVIRLMEFIRNIDSEIALNYVDSSHWF